MTIDKEILKYHTLTNGTKTIKIYGVRHVAPQDDLDILQARISRDHSRGFAIHHEGVELPKKYSKRLGALYTLLANLAGQSLQEKPTVPYTIHDISYKSLPLRGKLAIKGMMLMLKPSIYLLSRPDIQETLKDEILGKTETTRPTDLPKFLEKTVMTDRNAYAIKQALTHDGNVTLVWGKAHVPGMLELLKKEGFVLVL